MLSVLCLVQNFDEVLVPPDHVSRNPNDTYYVNHDTVLRCHTSAHQAELLRQGEKAFLVTGQQELVNCSEGTADRRASHQHDLSFQS